MWEEYLTRNLTLVYSFLCIQFLFEIDYMYFYSANKFKRTLLSKILSNFNITNCTRISIGNQFGYLLKIKQACQRSDSLLSAVWTCERGRGEMDKQTCSKVIRRPWAFMSRSYWRILETTHCPTRGRFGNYFIKTE